MLEEERKRREELEILKAEYEKLLDDERKAREEEENVRKLQEKILDEEKQKREDLEAIKAMQEELLEQERKQREGLEEESKEQAKVLEEVSWLIVQSIFYAINKEFCNTRCSLHYLQNTRYKISEMSCLSHGVKMKIMQTTTCNERLETKVHKNSCLTDGRNLNEFSPNDQFNG